MKRKRVHKAVVSEYRVRQRFLWKSYGKQEWTAMCLRTFRGISFTGTKSQDTGFAHLSPALRAVAYLKACGYCNAEHELA